MKLQSLKFEKLSPQQLKMVTGGSGAGSMVTKTQKRTVTVDVGNGQTRTIEQTRDLVFSWKSDYETFDETCYEGTASNWTQWY